MKATSLEQLAQQLGQGRMTLCDDSRLVKPGDVFVALPGSMVDGAAFVADALNAGAAYIVGTQAALAGCPAEKALVCENPQAALGFLASAFFHTGNPGYQRIGITGTNGKTTCAYMLEHLYTALGKRVGVLGTINYRWPGHSESAKLTTPGCLALHRHFGAMGKAGVSTALMEVSSHAIDQQRIAGLSFDGAIFTNLTQDHLDYHRTMEAYFAAKQALFTVVPRLDKALAIGVDSEWGQRLYASLSPQAREKTVVFGIDKVRVREYTACLLGTLEAQGPQGMTLGFALYRHGEVVSTWRFATTMIGHYNVENMLAAQAMLLALGHLPEDCMSLANFTGVPGRLERVPNTRGVHAFVDFAHTPDALDNILSTLKASGFKRVVTVFGCGGNRDRAKRPLMGEAVARWSDAVVLTSDNPRDEDPLAIMDDVKPGLVQVRHLECEPDRRKAIARGIALTGPDDVLLVAGKGHEAGQTIAGVSHPFQDVKVTMELIECA